MYKHLKKSVKRALSLALVLMVMLLNVSPAFAAAEPSSKESSLSKAISISGKDASAALVQSLQKHGVTVNENTVLTVQPSGTGTGATELRVTEIEGNLITDSVFSAFNENGVQVSVSTDSVTYAEGTGSDTEIIDFFYDE